LTYVFPSDDGISSPGKMKTKTARITARADEKESYGQRPRLSPTNSRRQFNTRLHQLAYDLHIEKEYLLGETPWLDLHYAQRRNGRGF
jgi:hypothetical protein